MCLVTMLYRANVDQRALQGGELCRISQEGPRVIVGVGVGGHHTEGGDLWPAPFPATGSSTFDLAQIRC